MKKSLKFGILAAGFIGFGFFGAFSAQAATLYMVPKAGSLRVGQNFSVEIMSNTGGSSFNAAQATIQFPRDLLQVTSVDNSASASIFNFWLEGPTFSNENGRVHFIGGTSNGVSGQAIPIIKINFQAKKSGEAPLQFTDSAITAADGSGSNILTGMEVASFRISGEAVTATAPAEVTSVPAPVLITRTPTAAEGLPQKPQITIPLYPDQEAWYNISSEFLAKWVLPSDVTDVIAKLDANANFSGTASEGLFESKVFPPILNDGVWYLHVRFKNSNGWGPAANYKIRLDTRPSSYFKVEFLTGGVKSDDPAPKIRFVSSDGLSGIRGYEVSIDDKTYTDIKKNSFDMPLQAPGKHSLRVKIFDNAGNFIEDSSQFETLPIAAPTISFQSPDVFVGVNRLNVSGTSLTGTTILLSLKADSGEVHYQTEVPVDMNGNWQFVVDHYMPQGRYYIEIQAKDARSALSLPVRSEEVSVREKPVLTIGSLELTQFWLFTILVLLLLAAFGIGWTSYSFWVARVGRKAVIAKRDISNLLNSVIKSVDSVGANLGAKDFEEKNRTEAKFQNEKARQDLKRMEKYLLEEITEIAD